jgi:hypothetical protein
MDEIQPEILEERYRFIHDNVFLVAHVNTKTGKQLLIMEKIDPISGKVEFSDYIECIHTAITDISFEELEGLQTDEFLWDEFYRKTLEIRSSENLFIVNLSMADRFLALKSWTQGIAEAGKEAFQLETDIEIAGHLFYPLAGKLLLFMVRVDTDFIFEYVSRVERICVFEGVRHQPSLMANVMPILDLLYEDFARPVIKDRVKVLAAMHSIVEFPLESVSRGSQNIIRYYLRDHPKYAVKYLISVVERECIQKKMNRQIMFACLVPLCQAVIDMRHTNFTELDAEFFKIILSLDPDPNFFLNIILFLDPLKKSLKLNLTLKQVQEFFKLILSLNPKKEIVNVIEVIKKRFKS